jgi:hypothetical protein
MANVDEIVQSLLELGEEELTAQVGARSQSIEIDPDTGDLASLESEPIATSRASFDDLIKIGQNVFGPASSGAYNLLCSPVGGDTDLAQQIDSLMNQKTTEASAKATALLSPILAGSLGLPQSLAVVVGALVVKKLAKGTSDFVCENWKKNLAADGTPIPPVEATPVDAATISDSGTATA